MYDVGLVRRMYGIWICKADIESGPRLRDPGNSSLIRSIRKKRFLESKADSCSCVSSLYRAPITGCYEMVR